MAANAGLSFKACSAKRDAAVCCCGALDFADDVVAIHVEKISTGGNGENGEAFLGPGVTARFEPSPLEVHRQAAGWFWDQEIFDFIADHLHLMMQHSLRAYCHASELKQAGLDWRQAVLGRCLTGVALAVAKLKANPAFGSEDDRVRDQPIGQFVRRANGFVSNADSVTGKCTRVRR